MACKRLPGALKRTVVRRKSNGVGLIKASSVETPPIRLFEPLQTKLLPLRCPSLFFFPSFVVASFIAIHLQLGKLNCVGGVWKMEPADLDFYKIGFAQSFRASGVAFIEGPSGFGVCF